MCIILELFSDLNQSIDGFKLLDSVPRAFLAGDLSQGRDAVSLEAMHELKIHSPTTLIFN